LWHKKRLTYDLLFHIPPLRARREDIPALVEFFLERLSRDHTLSVNGVTAEAIRVMMEQSWPGNVRQVQKVVEAAGIKSGGAGISAAQVTRALAAWDGHGENPNGSATWRSPLERLKADGLKQAVEEHERQLLVMLLDECRSRREAARRAGLSLSTLQYKIRKFGLEERNPLLSQRE